jgi:hypothetical protein
MHSRFYNLLRAFQYRNYRLFFLGQSIAITGAWMTLAAMGWLVFRLTHDPYTLGLVGFFKHVPTFFSRPWVACWWTMSAAGGSLSAPSLRMP